MLDTYEQARTLGEANRLILGHLDYSQRNSEVRKDTVSILAKLFRKR